MVNQPPNLWKEPKRRWPRRLALSLLVVALISGVGLAYATWRAQQISAELSSGEKGVVVQKAKKELGRSVNDPLAGVGRLEQSKVFLLIGSDRRWGEKERGRSDTVMLVRLDPSKNEASILSIPRDTLVDIPGYGQDKINHSYSLGGPALLLKTVRQWLGIPIDHFAEVSFQGFSTTVNDIGGAYLPIDGRYLHVNDGSAENNWAEIDIKPGYQKLSGSRALSWVRFRHLDTDSLRAARQQIFLREMGRQVRANKDNYANLPSIIRSFAKASASDINSIPELLSLANTARQIPPSQIKRMTMPVSDQMINGVYYGTVTEEDKAEILEKWSGATNDDPAVSDNTSDEPVSTEASGDTNIANPTRLIKNREIRPLLEKSKVRLALCLPTKLPQGFQWGSDETFRSYRINRHAAASAWATAGSGQSINWMWTDWSEPPILEQPSQTIERRGREYQLFEESGNLHMIAWLRQGTWTWISNTLDNRLNRKEMFALASSCKDLPAPPPLWPKLPLLPENSADRAFLLQEQIKLN